MPATLHIRGSLAPHCSECGDVVVRKQEDSIMKKPALVVGPRRLLMHDELMALRDLLLDAPIYTEHFPDHKKWVQKVILEIEEGDRVAYGAYLPTLEPEAVLLGSIILKNKPYPHMIHAKGLFVRKDIEGLKAEFIERVYISLLREADIFAAKNGASSVVTYCPWNEIDIIKVLHRHGFHIQKVEVSPYKRGEFLYILTKPIQAYYVGDPFDWGGIARWLVKDYYAFSFQNAKQQDGIEIINFLLSRSPSGPFGNNQIPQPQLSGQMYVTQPQRVESICGNTDANLTIVLTSTLSDRIRDFCESRGVVIFDERKVKKHLAEFFAYPMPCFSRQEIRGMIGTIKEEYAERIKANNGYFTYFKGGDVGKYLKQGDALVLVKDVDIAISQSGRVATEHHLVGIAEVIQAESGKPLEMWERFKKKRPSLTEEEYRRFAQEKSSVTAIVAQGFKAAKGECHEEIVRIVQDATEHKIGHTSDQANHVYLKDMHVDLFRDHCLGSERPADIQDRAELDRGQPPFPL